MLDEVVEHVVDDGLGIVAVDGLGGLVGFAAHEHELLRYGLVVLLLVDPALLIHLLEDGLLPGFIVLAADEGVVLRGVVRDADDARALGEREVLRFLAEVGLGGSVDAVAALAEVDDVEVPLHDLFLIIGLLEFERLEDLEQLALHGDIVLLGEVFDELLRDGRAAEVVFHRQEHVDEPRPSCDTSPRPCAYKSACPRWRRPHAPCPWGCRHSRPRRGFPYSRDS